jgi:hypothetical protein
VLEGVEVEVRHRLEHRQFHLARRAVLLAVVERAEDAVGGIEAGDQVGDRRPHHARVGRVHQQPQVAAGGLRHAVVGRAGARPGPVAPKPLIAQ